MYLGCLSVRLTQVGTDDEPKMNTTKKDMPTLYRTPLFLEAKKKKKCEKALVTHKLQQRTLDDIKMVSVEHSATGKYNFFTF